MQINRLFEMVYLLLNKKRCTASELAEHFEVSTRTIYRDVELLSTAGIPIFMTKGKGGGISLLPDFVLNKTVLTDDEKSDILSALTAVDALSLDHTNTAVRKLSSLFGSGNSANWIEVDFSGWDNANEEAHVFAALKSAILTQQAVAFEYHSAGGSSHRTVEPLKLCFKGQSWYLYAYCRLRSENRFFKLRRIKSLTVLEEYFIRQAPAKIFNEEKSFPDTFATITLKIDKTMAYRVYDEFAERDVLENGSFIVQLTMPQDDWLYQYLATFGEHCVVLSPDNVREQVKTKLQKTLQQYL